ncbi:hypothetical protein Patl1_22694 [Pistacia atlantica]|uniref:Uncharacterized protein n=1 Tax=Pistacia atlantica TaxID=434234 RepID=A0ACC1A0E8_9ROSI|nr:hypothetical protein Patl1_22694 [Pistacia atlantica]
MVQLISILASNLNIIPQPLDIVIEEFIGGDGGGQWFLKGLRGGGFGWGRKRKTGNLGVLVILAFLGFLYLLCGGELKTDVFCGVLGIGSSGFVLIRGLKRNVKALIFGMCCFGILMGLGWRREEATRWIDEFRSYPMVEILARDMKSGLQVFDKIPKWNVVAWTTLIAGYVNSDCFCEAIRVFKDMENFNVEPNEITMTNVLVASGKIRDLATGKWAHDRVCELGYDPFESKSNCNVILATAIVDMYAKCGCLTVARDLFNKMPKRNLVAWNSMIAGYNQYGHAEEALGIFSEMRFSGFDPDKATFLSVISASAKLGALALGQSLHAYVSKLSIEKDTKDAMAWTSMIIGLAMHGHGEEALSTFKRMQEDPNVTPDQITYIGVLFACSHVGLVEEGKRHFAEMSGTYGILPSIEHYGCMVDLLSRAGHFEEAERLVEQMPVEPNAAVWGALLNGCEIYENVKLANLVRSRVGESEPLGSGVHVLLSNIYARAGRWQDVKMAREFMKNRKIVKNHGHSAVEMKLLT